MALGTSDIRNYFPSVTPELVVDCLSGEAETSRHLSVVFDFLKRLAEVGAPPGLPMGPEASGLIGNFLLSDLDSKVKRYVLGHVRFMDDSWLFLRSESNWPEVHQVYLEAAREIGLEVNDSKTRLYMKHSGAALDAIEVDLIAYAVSPGNSYYDADRAAAEILIQLQCSEPNWHIIRFFLGSLRQNRSPVGLKVLYDNPRLLREEPRAVGRYLLALTSGKDVRATIDRDWIVEIATKEPVARSLAGQLHVCRAASRLRLGRKQGRCMEEMACSDKMYGNSPLQSWMFKAWGASEAFRPDRAVSYASHFGDFSVRRSLALTIQTDSSTPTKCATWYRKLRSVEPDLEPMLARLV